METIKTVKTKDGKTRKKSSVKFCWLAREHKTGWTVAFYAGNDAYPIRGLRFATVEDVKKVFTDKVVFVFMAASEPEVKLKAKKRKKK